MSSDDPCQGVLFDRQFAQGPVREDNHRPEPARLPWAASRAPAQIVLFPRTRGYAVNRGVRPESDGQFAFSFPEGLPQQNLITAQSDKPIAFPLARRHPLVARLFKLVQEASSASEAERILQGRLARLRRTLRRKHVPESIISRDLERLDAAVHALLPSPHSEERANG